MFTAGACKGNKRGRNAGNPCSFVGTTFTTCPYCGRRKPKRGDSKAPNASAVVSSSASNSTAGTVPVSSTTRPSPATQQTINSFPKLSDAQNARRKKVKYNHGPSGKHDGRETRTDRNVAARDASQTPEESGRKRGAKPDHRASIVGARSLPKFKKKAP